MPREENDAEKIGADLKFPIATKVNLAGLDLTAATAHMEPGEMMGTHIGHMWAVMFTVVHDLEAQIYELRARLEGDRMTEDSIESRVQVHPYLAQIDE